jgi:hypothetical protein
MKDEPASAMNTGTPAIRIAMKMKAITIIGPPLNPRRSDA